MAPAGFAAGGFSAAGTAPFFGTPGVVNNFGAEGTKVPDVVANLRFDQAWGSAQLSGALHELSALNTFVPFGAPVGTAASRADDDLGFAIQAGVMFKMPYFAPGDELWLQATYADGASSYAGSAEPGDYWSVQHRSPWRHRCLRRSVRQHPDVSGLRRCG